jgi:hypothetical protein
MLMAELAEKSSVVANVSHGKLTSRSEKVAKRSGDYRKGGSTVVEE